MNKTTITQENVEGLKTNEVELIHFGCEYNYMTVIDHMENKIVFTLRQKETIEYLKKFGGNTIKVICDYTDYDNETDLKKYLRRIAKTAKETGYINKVSVKPMYQEQDGIRKEWTEISGKFVKGVE